MRGFLLVGVWAMAAWLAALIPSMAEADTNEPGAASAPVPKSVASNDAPVVVAPPLMNEELSPYNSATNLGAKLDWMHDWTYRKVYTTSGKVDGWFVPKGGIPKPMPPARLRLGLYTESLLDKNDQFKLTPVIDADTELEFPNVEERVNLIVTTIDPNRMPGSDVTEQQDSAIRVAVSKDWTRFISTDLGVRARWPPEPYANVAFSPRWEWDDWKYYTQEKVYWEVNDGFGGLSSLVIDHWKGRWDFRNALSVKWTETTRDGDHVSGRKDEGVRYSYVFIVGHARELLDETQLGRVISGSDLARGGGLRFVIAGGPHSLDSTTITYFMKWRTRADWLYFVVAPEVSWSDANDWVREYTLKVGFDVLMWGSHGR
jgi:hypothetical protein